MLIKTQLVFGPLERILDEIERSGEIDTAGATPIFQPQGESDWYPLAPAISGIGDFYEMWATRHHVALDTSALQRLASKLEYAMPISQGDLDDARATMDKLRRVNLERSEAIDLIRQTQIKAEIEHGS